MIWPTLPVPLILSVGRRGVGFLRDEPGVGAAPKGGRAASDSFGDGTKAVEKERAEAFETATGAEVDENVFLFGKHKNAGVGGKFNVRRPNAAKRGKAERRKGDETTGDLGERPSFLILKESAALRMEGGAFSVKSGENLTKFAETTAGKRRERWKICGKMGVSYVASRSRRGIFKKTSDFRKRDLQDCETALK